MAVFKCKMCGGTLEINNETVAVCQYCGTKQTIPKSRDEVVSNLFNRANNLRLKCEFDKAEQVYEKILDINNTESEAHWGIVLCRYGIEYVEDPKTYSRIPTCHRTLYEAVLTDVDYLSAIENADAEQKELYIAEAKIIDELQKNILAIVNSEEPFDVFICYKETDEDGKRTVDSAIANDIYYQLTGECFKVFYAPITLEDKLGHEYEPYIFAALNSAKVMLVIGTKPEYFDSVWVRNEWSRFIKLTKSDRSKMIIPCYRNMDAYELPDEFAHLQAQDMGKIGFITDVIRGLKKVFGRDEQLQIKPKKFQDKKPSKIKMAIENLKRKRKEQSKYCFVFPTNNTCKILYFISLFLNVFLLCKGVSISGLEFIFLPLPLQLFSLLIPTLIIAKVNRYKVLSIIIQIICIAILFCADVSYIIESGLFIFYNALLLLNIMWMIFVCGTKKVEKVSIKKIKKTKLLSISFIIALFIIIASELGCWTYCDYQLAKVFYSTGQYEYADEYFTYLDDYKDSKKWATLSYKAYINTFNYNDEIKLWLDSGSIWKVIDKKDDRILLIRSDPIYGGDSLLGGWENSELRSYLNGNFYSDFDIKLRDLILSTDTTIDGHSQPLSDKVFILSEEEMKEYDVYCGSILRDSINNTYKIVNTDSSVSYVEYINIPEYTGTGFREYAEYIKQWSQQEDINAAIENPYCCPAMWIDISGIG